LNVEGLFFTDTFFLQEEINPKRLQINLTPFLEKKTAGFVKELWDLLLSAQDNIGGIPTIILEQKQRELMQLKVIFISIVKLQSILFPPSTKKKKKNQR